MFCPKCHNEVKSYDVFCCHCGANLLDSENDKSNNESFENKKTSKYCVIGVVVLLATIICLLFGISQCNPTNSQKLRERLYSNSNAVWEGLSKNGHYGFAYGTAYDILDSTYFAGMINFYEDNTGSVEYGYDSTMFNYTFEWYIDDKSNLEIIVYNEKMDLENLNGTYTYSEEITSSTWHIKGGDLCIGTDKYTCSP